MSQHDFNIANQTAVDARTDINNALVALASLNSGTSAPSTTYANMLWYETDTNRLWMRNEGNSAWLSLGYIDQSNGLEPYINGKRVTDFLDQDNMSSNSSTAVASQQSIKSYVDNSLDFPASLGALNSEGYVQLPNGLIINWGQTTSIASTKAVTFSKAFPNNAIGGMATIDSTSPYTSGNFSCYIGGLTTTGATVVADSDGPSNLVNAFWLVWGR